MLVILDMRSLHFQVKVLKKPRFELSKLLELHGDGKAGTDEPGAKVERPEGYEPPVQESV
jgi:small subunit ribosomal protein S3Ae